jgi:diaminopimelate epimerase
MIHFYKYHGTGNDFIIIDAIKNQIPVLNTQQIKHLCDRRFGIGADGIMILKKHPPLHFEMDYYNSDGTGGTMCGNGGRCIAKLAYTLGYAPQEITFLASDGIHEAEICSNGIVDLKMNDVENVIKEENGYSCYTGSPHLIVFVNDTDQINVFDQGRIIRYSEKYKQEGININFIEIIDQFKIKIRTYERGVEDETLSCGTGSVASALTYAELNQIHSGQIEVEVKGGQLSVVFVKKNQGFTNIRLKGPAEQVFEGTTNIDEF